MCRKRRSEEIVNCMEIVYFIVVVEIGAKKIRDQIGADHTTNDNVL